MKNKLDHMKTTLSKIIDTLAACIVPNVPILVGVGMLKVVLMLLSPTVFNILPYESNTYIVLSFAAEAGFYFLPIYICVSSAEVFKTNKYIAALIGATLLSPVFVQYVTNQNALSVFGLPIYLTNYGSQMIPSIILTYILSLVYGFLDKVIHENLKPLLVPLLSIVIMVPISFCAIGPLGVIISDKLANIILFLRKLGPFGNAILCILIPFFVLTGLGGINLTMMLIFAASGVDPIVFFSNVIWNCVLGFSTFGLYLINKNSETLAAAITSFISGTSEPALFGHVLKNRKSFIATLIGCFIAGLYSGISGVKTFSMSSYGVFGIISTIGPGSSIVSAAISLLIGCISSLILTIILNRSVE